MTVKGRIHNSNVSNQRKPTVCCPRFEFDFNSDIKNLKSLCAFVFRILFLNIGPRSYTLKYKIYNQITPWAMTENKTLNMPYFFFLLFKKVSKYDRSPSVNTAPISYKLIKYQFKSNIFTILWSQANSSTTNENIFFYHTIYPKLNDLPHASQLPQTHLPYPTDLFPLRFLFKKQQAYKEQTNRTK